MSVNPFDVVSFVGRLTLSPSSDTWFDIQTIPDIVANVNGQNDNYAGFSSVETQWNAWQTLWTGEKVVDETSTQTITNTNSADLTASGYQVTRDTLEVSQYQVRTGTETLKAPPGVVLSTSTSTSALVPNLDGVPNPSLGSVAGQKPIPFSTAQSDNDPAFVDGSWRIGATSSTGYTGIFANGIGIASTATASSTSTGASSGSSATPIAERAATPSSPQSSLNNSDAPLATNG